MPPGIHDHLPRVPHHRLVSHNHARRRFWQFRPELLLLLPLPGRLRAWVWPPKWLMPSFQEDVGYAMTWGYQALTDICRRSALGTRNRVISNAMFTPDVWQK